MHKTPKIQAFTLLEMTIVLAIIGLLAGGIVAGKSFIRSSQLVTTVNQGKMYLSAVNQFEMKYTAIPGDMSTASAVWSSATHTIDGDGNGRIWFDPAGAYKPAEFFLAFEHLNKAGLITGNFTGMAGPLGTDHGVIGTNIPAAPVNGVGYVLYDISDNGYVTGNTINFDGFYGHVVRIAGEATTNSTPNVKFLTPIEALKLDSKFDDSRPGTGLIRGPKASYSFTPNCTNGDVATADYKTSFTSLACFLVLVGNS